MEKSNLSIVGALVLTGILCACGSGAPSTSGPEISIPTKATTDTQSTLDFLPPPDPTLTTADQPTSGPDSTPASTMPPDGQTTSEIIPSTDSTPDPGSPGGTTLSPTVFLTPDPSRPTSKNGPLCDDSQFVDDVTIPDGTVLKPGDNFKKTWRIKNTGICGWTTSYAIGFAYGVKMRGSDTKLPKSVAPGATVDITVNFTAPMVNCWYGSWWRLKNARGDYFGDFVYVSVLVTDGTEAGTPYPTLCVG